MTYDLRPARPDEAEALTRLAQASKAHWGYPQAWLDAWRPQLTFTPAYLAAHPVYVAARPDGTPAACYALAPCADGLEIDHFWVHPTAQGEGLGRRLYAHALEEARRAGAEVLWIDADPNAEAFYLHMGALRVGAVRADVAGTRRELPRLCAPL